MALVCISHFFTTEDKGKGGAGSKKGGKNAKKGRSKENQVGSCGVGRHVPLQWGGTFETDRLMGSQWDLDGSSLVFSCYGEYDC